MQTVARYKATDTEGRAHLVDELVDKKKRWMELLDGTQVKRQRDGSFLSARGESFVEMVRD